MAESKYAAEFGAIQIALDALEPLQAEQRQFAIRVITERLGLGSAAPARPGGVNPSSTFNAGLSSGSGEAPTPKQFLREKQPATDVERMACLAYYLTHFRNTAHFKTNDLTKLNTEAAAPQFANAANTAGNAVSQNKFLAAAGGGKRQITALGEDVVGALPNREAVAKAIASQPKRKGRGPSRKGAEKQLARK